VGCSVATDIFFFGFAHLADIQHYFRKGHQLSLNEFLVKKKISKKEGNGEEDICELSLLPSSGGRAMSEPPIFCGENRISEIG
jgi:hypothetical protein